MFELIAEMLSYSFMRRALIAGLLVALCSALLGVTLVLKRYSMIGDGLSHVGFGALAVASALGLAPLAVAVPAVVAAAVLLLRLRQNAKVKGDAAVAMLSVSSLGMGYLLMNVFSKSANLSGDVCSILFGSFSILTLKPEEVQLCAVLSAVCEVFYLKGEFYWDYCRFTVCYTVSC